jgi:hypothetical protein
MIVVNVTALINGNTAIWLPHVSEVFHADTSVSGMVIRAASYQEVALIAEML